MNALETIWLDKKTEIPLTRAEIAVVLSLSKVWRQEQAILTGVRGADWIVLMRLATATLERLITNRYKTEWSANRQQWRLTKAGVTAKKMLEKAGWYLADAP